MKMEGLGLVFIIVIAIVFILMMRALGAWMLRIDDVIREQRRTNELLEDLKLQRRDIYKAENKQDVAKSTDG